MSTAMSTFRKARPVAVIAVVVAFLASYAPPGAFGQAGTSGASTSTAGGATQSSAQTPQQQNPITQPLALSPELPSVDARVGITPGQIQTLAMQEAITFALQNNLDIESFRQGVQISQKNLYSLRGIYDIVSGSDVHYTSQTTPVANIFGGAGSTGSFTQRGLTYNFTTNQPVERTGGFWEVDFNNNRVVTSSTASTLPTQYSSTISASFTQPILRNFSIDQNRRLIRIAKKALDLSDSQFRQQVIETISSVQRAYWDLVFAIKNEQIARESVELARTQLDNNRRMVEAGTLAPIELRSNEAQLEQNKGNVILAMQGITTAENVLKGLVMKDPSDKLWNSAIKPTDEPQNATSPIDLDESIRVALKNRPELDQLRIQIEQKQVDVSFYKNQLKPQLDFVGVMSSTGLAGTPSTLLTGDPPTPLGASVPERFQGGFLQNLSNVFSGDFKTYQFGVRFSFPWRNRTAEGNLGRSLAEERQLDARQRQLVQNVQIDVRNALQAVEAARRRYEAARAARLAADAQLKGEEEKFRAGLTTNFVVLQRQTDYSNAQGNEVRALTDYNKALADLQRVTGVTLVSNNVQVSAQPDTK